MRRLASALLLLIIAVGAVLIVDRRTAPPIDRVRSKITVAQAVLEDIEREISERAEEEGKFRVLKDALYLRYKALIKKKEDLRPRYLLATIPADIAAMETDLEKNIKDMKSSLAGWKEREADNAEQLARLEERIAASPAEARRLAKRADVQRASLAEIRRTIRQAASDIERSETVLSERR